MGEKTAGVGHFTIPTAPAAGTSCTSGLASVFTTTYVQLIASTAAAIFITGIYVERGSSAPTYLVVQLATGAAGSETIVGQHLIALPPTIAGALGYKSIIPPIPVATATRISCKTADSIGSVAALITLECINQSNVVDDGVAVGTVTTVTNQLTAAQIATGIWQDATAGDFTTASSIGKALYIANIVPGASGGHMIAGSNAGTTTFGAFTVTGAFTVNGVSDVAQTGDSFARIGAAGAGLTGVTGVTLAAAQKVDVDTIKTNPVVNAGTVTFPTGATLASTTNITAGTITTATNLTTNNDKTGYSLASGQKVDVDTIKTQALTCAAPVTVLASVGTAATSTAQTGDSFGRIGLAGVGLTNLGDTRIGNLDAAVSTRTKPADTQAAVTTVTNLTNAPTVGDFTATMKTSITTAATAATPSVTVTTNNDKTGYALSSAGVQAIWDALLTALTTVGSIGKKLADWVIGTAQTGDSFARIGAAGAGLTALGDTRIANLDATVSSRMATFAYTAPDNTSIAAIKVQTDKLTFTVANQVDANIRSVNSMTVSGSGTGGSPWGP